MAVPLNAHDKFKGPYVPFLQMRKSRIRAGVTCRRQDPDSCQLCSRAETAPLLPAVSIQVLKRSSPFWTTAQGHFLKDTTTPVLQMKKMKVQEATGLAVVAQGLGQVPPQSLSLLGLHG